MVILCEVVFSFSSLCCCPSSFYHLFFLFFFAGNWSWRRSWLECCGGFGGRTFSLRVPINTTNELAVDSPSRRYVMKQCCCKHRFTYWHCGKKKKKKIVKCRWEENKTKLLEIKSKCSASVAATVSNVWLLSCGCYSRLCCHVCQRDWLNTGSTAFIYKRLIIILKMSLL